MAKHDIMIAPDFDPLDPSAGGGPEDRHGLPVDKSRVQRALWAGRYWLAAAVVGGLLLGFLAAKFLVKNPYHSTARLQYSGATPIAGMPPPDPGALGAAAGALEQQSVLKQIKEKTGFEGTITGLKETVQHTVDYQSSVIDIKVSDDTPQGAAEFAKTVADVFVKHHEQQQARNISAKLEDAKVRIEAASAETDIARKQFTEFRDKHGLVNLGTAEGDGIQSAAQLRAKAELSTSEIRALEGRVQSLEQQLKTTPKTTAVSSSASPESLEYNRLQAQLASARTSLSEEHPRVQALKQQVAQLRKQIQSGKVGKIATGTFTANATYLAIQQQLQQARADLEALRSQQKGLSELADTAEQRVSKTSDVQGTAASLLSKVKVNERLVADLQGTKASLEDALHRPSSGFVITDSGSVPEYAERSRSKYLVLGGVPLGLTLATLLFFFGREFRGLKVRTPAEVGYWGRGPVIGASTWPKDARAIDELVADLDDYAPDAKGLLLLVGATENEAPMVQELADRLNNDWFPDQQAIMSAIATKSPSTSPSAGPLRTPAPGTPYPLATAQPQRGSALARPLTPSAHGSLPLSVRPPQMRVDAWDGPPAGQGLRRAARLADRVLVLVYSGTLSAMELSAVRTRLGREQGVGYVVIGLSDDMLELPDRMGDVDAFWRTVREDQPPA